MKALFKRVGLALLVFEPAFLVLTGLQLWVTGHEGGGMPGLGRAVILYGAMLLPVVGGATLSFLVLEPLARRLLRTKWSTMAPAISSVGIPAALVLVGGSVATYVRAFPVPCAVATVIHALALSYAWKQPSRTAAGQEDRDSPR